MKNILVTSLERYSGKSAICIGLGLVLKDEGYRIGYMRPFGNRLIETTLGFTDIDTEEIKEIFQLEESYEEITPVLLTDSLLSNVLDEKITSFDEVIEESYKKVKKNKDFLLIEDFGDLQNGFLFQMPIYKLSSMFESKILLVIKYESDIVVDRILASRHFIDKERIIGVILNDVPEEKQELVRDKIVPFLKKRGMEVIGSIPQNDQLRSITTKEIAEGLGGKIICAREYSDNLVKNFSVGAMSYENALRYFRKMSEKAVITGGDRAEIQAAALETPTNCLILTGNLDPSPVILSRAEELHIPIVLVPLDTLTTVERLEKLFHEVRIKGRRKLEIMKKLVKENVDIEKIKKEIGIGIK